MKEGLQPVGSRRLSTHTVWQPKKEKVAKLQYSDDRESWAFGRALACMGRTAASKHTSLAPVLQGPKSCETDILDHQAGGRSTTPSPARFRLFRPHTIQRQLCADASAARSTCYSHQKSAVCHAMNQQYKAGAQGPPQAFNCSIPDACMNRLAACSGSKFHGIPTL